MTKKADKDQIRRQNRSIILQALRREGQMARIDLGRATRLSPATITAITSDMLDEGLIVGIEADEPKAPLARGRPRSLLALNGAAASVVGVRLSVNSIDLALADFTGRISCSRRVPFDTARADRDSFPALLVARIREFVADSAVDPASVREIGVASQGIVDTTTGEIVWSPAFAGRHIPIVAPLCDAFSADCTLSNDTNMITEALHWSEPGRYSGTFAVVMIDYGVGMGLFLDDHLFVGATGAAAEIGHANHIPGGALCRCGRRGCLEAYLADYALLRSATGLAEDTDPARVPVTGRTFEDLAQRAGAGDRAVLDTLERAGRALGYGLARLLAVIDPQRVVLTGAGVCTVPYMRAAMDAALEDALVEDLRRAVEIDVVPWNEDFIRRGLIARAMRRLDRGIFAAAGSSRRRPSDARPQRRTA
ncbi:ROK family transcriptional regulator [Polymorphum gilvum]|uniref:Xyl repressor n=1 Tax=Polymorphum gilvum (strain LMG 25793 / CGMCC 1.9160 / SL003B-26A1) TaxID=991905 RepID=F2IVS0_POLGS|nr:ROK family transcriptional regulator [Polymorphum gilvum]ADZ69177.1 Xyl repressor [Polymorphum gilvum SL003B-26A1]